MTRGIKSTEFWLGLGTIILTFFNKELGLDLPVEAIISVSGLVIAYIASRTYIKSR